MNFALRTPAEQQALTAGFGRWLNSLQYPAQILIRARRIDLAGMSARIRSAAGTLPHPALERAALDHAAFLDQLARTRDLLARQVLVAVTSPGAAARRISESARALASSGIAVTPLDSDRAAAALAACYAPGRPAPPATRRATTVVTAAGHDHGRAA